MKIIIDGNDGTGKTTLTKKLKEEVNITSYIHLSYKDPCDFYFYYYLLKKEDVIFDRSFIDEKIYSKIFNRQTYITNLMFNELYNQIIKEKIIVIICERKNKLYTKNEKKEIINAENEIDNYFKMIAKKYNYIIFNTEIDNYFELVKKIRKQGITK